MATLKTEKVSLSNEFQLELVPGWILHINTETKPTQYTLVHGKKSMTFHYHVMKDLCARNYGIRLAKGRRQMILPPIVLQAFVENEMFLMWYDGSQVT